MQHVFAYAAAQVKKALEVSHELGAENYVFWGGREGYQSLLNTNYRMELGVYYCLLPIRCIDFLPACLTHRYAMVPSFAYLY